jgi:hypothetical protein
LRTLSARSVMTVVTVRALAISRVRFPAIVPRRADFVATTGCSVPLPRLGTLILYRRRRQDLPGSWRTRYERALLFDPGGISALGRYRASMLPSAITTASASAISIISGLNRTARSLAVYASQDELPHHHARLASGWLAGLSGRGCLPAGSQRKVSGCSILLSQASPGAL